MSNHSVTIRSIEPVTHDVLRFVTDKPDGFSFKPGQATEVSIHKSGWKEEGRPFTFTSLPEDEYLEFTIKTYPSHDGVTDKLRDLKEADELILHDVFGAIQYKGTGTFIAGGAGVTPFISILRNLNEHKKLDGNQLIFSNKTRKDIILKNELENLLGDDFINILSEENADDYPHGHVDQSFLKKQVDSFDQYFYVCGPPPMIESVVEQLKDLGAEEDKIVIEES